MSKQREIYLDSAATTKCFEESLDLFDKINRENYGNPSSMHLMGVRSEEVLEEARESVAKNIGVDKKTIYFTSGATESNNMAILGGAFAKHRQGKHIITTSIEHSAVYEPIKYLESQGFEISYLPTDANGMVRMDQLAGLISSDTVLVSVMHVNNETGVIQPIEAIGNIITQKNDKIIYHVDGAQSVGKLPLNLKRSRVDLLSASAHKFHGLKGSGFLYKKENVRINEILRGGGQERGYRSGTVNTAAAAALALSLDTMYESIEKNTKHYRVLKDEFIKGIEKIEGCVINGYTDERAVGNIINVSFPGIRSEVLLHSLEESGIYISAGSACSTHGNRKSRTLSSMGLAGSVIDSSVRFSFSIFTTKEDIKYTVETLKEVVPKLMKFQRK